MDELLELPRRVKPPAMCVVGGCERSARNMCWTCNLPEHMEMELGIRAAIVRRRKVTPIESKRKPKAS